MRRKRHNEVLAGLLVVLSLAVALGVVLWLGAMDYFQTHGQVVSFYMPQADGSTGLTIGSEVTIGDASIGRITEIVGEPGRCIYRATLRRKDILIKEDAQALVIGAPLGNTKLAMASFGQSSQLADDAHAIKLHGGLDQAMASIADTAENIKAISISLRRELDTAQEGAIIARVHEIADNLKKASVDIVAITGNVRGQTDLANAASMFSKLAHSLDDVKAITSDSKPKIDRFLTSAADAAQTIEAYAKKDVADILARLRQSTDQIFKMASDLSEVSQQAKSIVVMNRENVEIMIDNMTQVSSNLKAMAKEVRRSPWRLLYQPTDKETRQQDIYEATRSFAEGASQLDMTVAKLDGLIKANPEGIPGDSKMLKDVLKDLKDTFTRFTKAEQALWNELER